MLRATSDLVCASSACPDDIDPSNAWEVTDVHVRVYSPENRFSMAIARRVTADAEAVLTRETAFHPKTSELTKSFVEYRGYWLPHCFNNEGGIAEYWACRERLAVMDLSPLRKWEVLGPDAETLMQHIVTRNIRKLAVGQVVYTALCNETGGMIDDATVFRLGQDNFRFIGGDEYDGIWMRQVADRLGLKVWIKPTTDQLHNIAVQGPLSREALAEFVWTPPSQPSLAGAQVVPLPGGAHRRLRRRADRRLAHRLHRRARLRDLLPPVRRRGGVGRGLEGRRAARHASRWASRRSTCCASSPGSSSPATSSTTRSTRSRPGSASRSRLDDEDFVGRDALLERREHPQRTLVGLELSGNEVAGHGDEVYVDRRRVGVVTSGTRSPLLRKSIALCRMAVQYSEIGTEVEVGKLDGLQKRIPATVVRFPFYDPEKKRPRS